METSKGEVLPALRTVIVTFEPLGPLSLATASSRLMPFVILLSILYMMSPAEVLL